MVGRLLGGVFNFVGSLFGGGNNQFARSTPAAQNSPGHSMKDMWHSWPGRSAWAPGHNKAPAPGKDHTPDAVKPDLENKGGPQQVPVPPPAPQAPKGKSGEKPAPGPKGASGEKKPPKGSTVVGNDPKISQFHPAGENANYTNAAMNCGPAVGAMVARDMGYGIGKTDAQLINELGKVAGTNDQGTTGNGMLAMYEHMGLDTNAAKGADLAWMQQQLQAGHHVTALGDYYEVPGHTEVGKTAGHYLDVTGMTAKGDFLVNDPANTKLDSMTQAEMTNFINQAQDGGFVLSAWKPAAPAAVG